MSDRVLLISPTSGIGRALAERLADQGNELLMAGRDTEEIQRIASDLRLSKEVAVSISNFDALAFDQHQAWFEDLSREAPLDGVILCYGDMVDQNVTETDFQAAAQTIDVNYRSYVSVLLLAAAYFEQRKTGFICALSSVAGDRGRQSNYTYGSSKAALTTYLQGLRNRLAAHGVQVLTVKPGFVDTAMTWGLLNPESPLVATPEKVASDIVRALERNKDVIYTPWFWRWIMLMIRLLPEPLFKRLKL